ncbi:hypothetical protein HK104_002623 [Borealophlyctis nickersoniae]|nr:hypothetical protein HK104_002623 [Borealophlyctis nickersoniae]
MTHSDESTHFILKDIRSTERNMANVRSALAGYLRNQERLRRKSLKLALVLKLFAETEANQLSAMLHGVSEQMTERENFRAYTSERTKDAQVPLALYKTICNDMRSEVKARENALEKERKKQQQLDRVMIKESTNRTKISQMELAGASKEVSHATDALVDSVQRFESKKRSDIKESLSEFLWHEMAFHARTLEILTYSHQLIQNADLDADLHEIQERINLAAAFSPPRRKKSFKKDQKKKPETKNRGDKGDHRGKLRRNEDEEEADIDRLVGIDDEPEEAPRHLRRKSSRTK